MTETRQLLIRELRGLGTLAAPVVIVQLGLMMMGTVDVMMLGRVSDVALAAGGLGHAVSMGLLIVGMGVLLALDPLVAQAFGARNEAQLGVLLKRGIVMSVVLSVPISLLFVLVADRLEWLRQPPELAIPARGYLLALLPGNLPFLLIIVWRQTLQAMSLMRPAWIAIIVANVFNFLANWVLVFGHLGFPPLGVTGSAIATSASRWLLFVLLGVLARSVLAPYFQAARERRVTLGGLLQLLRLGVPVGIQVGLEFYVFITVALIMGSLGSESLAAHQIAMNLASLSFMVPLGVAGAAATRVGNAVGRGDSPAARRSAGVALGLGATVMLLSAVLFWSFPDHLSRLYTAETSVLELAIILIPIAAIFQVADGTQVVGAGILRGVGDTRAPAIIAFVGFWALGLPLGWWLTYRRAAGPQGLWWGLTFGLLVVAVLLVIRIRVRLSGVIERLDQV